MSEVKPKNETFLLRAHVNMKSNRVKRIKISYKEMPCTSTIDCTPISGSKVRVMGQTIEGNAPEWKVPQMFEVNLKSKEAPKSICEWGVCADCKSRVANLTLIQYHGDLTLSCEYCTYCEVVVTVRKDGNALEFLGDQITIFSPLFSDEKRVAYFKTDADISVYLWENIKAGNYNSTTISIRELRPNAERSRVTEFFYENDSISLLWYDGFVKLPMLEKAVKVEDSSLRWNAFAKLRKNLYCISGFNARGEKCTRVKVLDGSANIIHELEIPYTVNTEIRKLKPLTKNSIIGLSHFSVVIVMNFSKGKRKLSFLTFRVFKETECDLRSISIIEKKTAVICGRINKIAILKLS